MKRLVPLACLLALGCAEPEQGIQPLPSTAGHPRRVDLEPPPPELVNPTLRTRERSAEERAAERERLGLTGEGEVGSTHRGGGGGGGVPFARDFTPRPATPPTERELQRFREELGRRVDEQVDREDDACDQFRDTMLAAAGAIARAEGREMPSPPSRRDVRAACREAPAAFMRCMDPGYFREHNTECQEELSRTERRGRRAARRNREELEGIRRGREPAPTEPEPDEDDAEHDDGF